MQIKFLIEINNLFVIDKVYLELPALWLTAKQLLIKLTENIQRDDLNFLTARKNYFALGYVLNF